MKGKAKSLALQPRWQNRARMAQGQGARCRGALGFLGSCLTYESESRGSRSLQLLITIPGAVSRKVRKNKKIIIIIKYFS